MCATVKMDDAAGVVVLVQHDHGPMLPPALTQIRRMSGCPFGARLIEAGFRAPV